MPPIGPFDLLLLLSLLLLAAGLVVGVVLLVRRTGSGQSARIRELEARLEQVERQER